MSQERLPPIGSFPGKNAAAPYSRLRKGGLHPHPPPSSSNSQPRPTAPPTQLFSDSAMAPWGGLSLSESSFTSIPAPPPPPPPTSGPRPAPPTVGGGRRHTDAVASNPNFKTQAVPAKAPPENTARGGRELRAPRRRSLPQRRLPHPPRLAPLRPVTNLSFTRNFTFSFFELPLHQTARSRAEQLRELGLLLRHIQY